MKKTYLFVVIAGFFGVSQAVVQAQGANLLVPPKERHHPHTAGGFYRDTNNPDRLVLPYLDDPVQNGVVVTVSEAGSGQVCPPKFTNLLSNTNLFKIDETRLLEGLVAKYKNVATNVGPDNSYVIGRKITSEGRIVVNFEYPTSKSYEEITFWPPKWDYLEVRFRSEPGEGYDLTIGDRGDLPQFPMFWYNHVSHGLPNGLCICVGNGELLDYLNYTNGLAIGNYFEWTKKTGRLRTWAEFKKPYDLPKHSIPLDE